MNNQRKTTSQKSQVINFHAHENALVKKYVEDSIKIAKKKVDKIEEEIKQLESVTQ